MTDSGIVKYDLQIPKNNKNHRTCALSQESRLFLRRGQEFNVTFSIPSQPKLTQEALGKWTLFVTTGPRPSRQNGTKNTFSISSLGDQKAWSARVVDKEQDLWIIMVTSPVNAIVGNYSLSIKTPNGQGQKLGEFMLLFNPWCRDDPVYLNNEAQRQEYILNEDGIIYLGTESCVYRHPWHFGQFEEEIADICIMFLNMSKYYKEDPEEHYLRRNDPLYVSRIISDVISGRDEDDRVDFMVQNGRPSYKWISSVPVLQQWFNREHRMTYGHHWVFAAVLCTVLRCLGIPTRIVTNYNSAHNTYQTLQKDLYYNESAARIHRTRNDSIWHFQVWNECWMQRRDLQRGYDGWQVLDATAQHKYNGELCCSGPAPVKAIKEGKVNWHYDVGLFFSKVATECLAWVRTSEGYFIKAFGNARFVGDSIATKSIGTDMQKDIVHKYKYPKEWSVSGRIAYSLYETALLDNNLVRVTALVKEPETASVRFTVAEQDVTVCKPSIVIQMAKTAVQFQPTKAVVVFTNPLKETLKNCKIRVSGKGLLHKERLYRCQDVASKSTLLYPITFTPTLAGTRRLYLQLDTNKFHVINGFQRLEVLPGCFKEWSTEHWEEYQKSAKEPIYSQLSDSRLSTSIHSEDVLMYGEDLYILLQVINQSRTEKDLCVVLYAQHICEGSDMYPHFWQQEIHFSLEAEEKKTLGASVLQSYYSDCLWGSNIVRVTGVVQDASSTIYTNKDVTVYKPLLDIQMTKVVTQYQPITATIFITNPLDDVLQDCTLTASGESLIHRKRLYGCQNIDPSATAAYNIIFAPTRIGVLQLQVEFECNQFRGVKIVKNFDVLSPDVNILSFFKEV
uniref:Transglutaminase-like domain-containing protein n=1 Tax=Leptobrachium leishanense TaxID=445787 RepID=A0A8C5R5W3_9ANUR